MKPLDEKSVADLTSALDQLRSVLKRELDRNNMGAVVMMAVRIEEIERFANDGVGR